MGNIQDRLVNCFVNHMDRYLPEAEGYYWLREVPLRRNQPGDEIEPGVNNWIDLILVEPSQNTSRWIPAHMNAEKVGAKYVGKRKNMARMIQYWCNGELTWIVEAKASTNELPLASRQLSRYQALFERDYDSHLKIAGFAIIYPDFQRNATVGVSGYDLKKELEVIPVDINCAEESRGRA